MKHNILFFPWRDWNKMEKEGFRTREANILLELLKREDINKIVCVNRSKLPLYVEKLLKYKYKDNAFIEKGDRKAFLHKETIYKGFFSDLVKINEKLYVLNINYHLPNPKGNRLEKHVIFQKLLHYQVRNALNHLQIIDYIVWSFDLSRVVTAKKFAKDLFIFDAIDNLLEHSDFQNDRKNIKSRYELVKKYSNIIFTVSNEIRIKLFNSQQNVYYVPNGINLDTYVNTVTSKPLDLPNGKPIVGYVGLLQERIDVIQLEKLIRSLKNCNFVFVGPVLDINLFKEIKKNENVFFLGAKHHSEIPNYIKNFDVCIIPHKVNDFTKSMNPLKLYEYLAAEKEVVTTPVPPFESFQEVIHVVKNTIDMKKTILEILSNPYSKFSKTDIKNKIINETWEKRVNFMFSKIIDEEKKTTLDIAKRKGGLR